MSNTITRKDLYNLVWSEPITILAKKFEVSEAELRKICIRMDIPLPKVGYWTKVKFGKEIVQEKLSDNYSGEKFVTLSPASLEVASYSHLSEQNILQKKFDGQLGTILRVPDKLTKPDTIITNTKTYLTGSVSYDEVVKRGIEILDMSVTKSSLDRALRIMDTFIKAVRHRGHDIVFKNRYSYVAVKGQQIKIFLKEKEKRIINSESKFSWETHVMVPTGLLYLRIMENWRCKEFCDEKIPLEEKLSLIIVAIETEADQWIELQAQHAALREERERERIAELLIQQQKDQEIKDFNLLVEKANKFHQASLIRDYIKEVEITAKDQNRLTEELIEEIRWAHQKADWLDPTVTMFNYD